MKPRRTIAAAIGVLTLIGCETDPFLDVSWPEARPLGQDLPTPRPPDEPGSSAQVAADLKATRPFTAIPNETLTLRDVQSAALLMNPSLSRFGYEVRAAEAVAFQAGRTPNPELAVEVENFGGAGDFSGTDAAEVTVAVSQSIPLGGDLHHARRLAEAEGRLVGWDYEAARVSLLAEVTERYVQVLGSQRRLALAQESRSLAERVAESIGRRVAAGDAAAVEQTRAAVPVATAQIAVRRAERQLEADRVRLSLAWGESEPRFERVAGELDRIEPVPTLTSVAGLISQNPEVARWATEIASRQAAAELARAEAAPDLTATLGYKWFNETDDSALVAAVSIPLPVFDRNRGATLAARFGVAAATDQQRAVELKLEAALASAYARLSAASEEAITLRDAAIPPAQQAYDALKTGFDRGDVGFLDVLDAERTLFDLREQHLNALIDYHAGVAEVEGLIGQPLDSIPLVDPDSHPE